jgi:hypothetical protein
LTWQEADSALAWDEIRKEAAMDFVTILLLVVQIVKIIARADDGDGN